MDTRFSKYAAFFGRSPDFVRDPPPGAPQISVGRFPPISAGLFRRLFTPVRDRFVYITHGMSATPMRVPAEVARLYPAKIELIAYCREAYIGAQDGQDMVSACLQALAVVPFEMDIFFGPMHTAAMEESFGPNPEMTAFFFAVPDGVEMRRLCSCTPAAELVVSVMPITSSERAYAVERGPEPLLDLFVKQRVPNFFDPFRKSVVQSG